MSISRNIAEAMEGGSWIRKMFEEGNRLKAEFGAENVFDFSLGNPDLPPPPEFQKILMEEAAKEAPLLHCYMPNAGYVETRAALANHYQKVTQRDFNPQNIVMTSGAGGAMNVVLKSILEPGDEVLVLAPFFVEYGFYITNHGGEMVISQTDERFMPDLDDIEQRITNRTRAVIINSPNNPTGVMYSEETLNQLSELLRTLSAKQGRTLYLISDEPYRELVFDNKIYPSPFRFYDETIVVTSNSKDLSLAGERIGHIAIGPDCAAQAQLSAACTFSNRILGFVNANALMQRVVARLVGTAVDVSIYQRRKDLITRGLRDAGFEFEEPSGAFYLFPKSPIEDDREFASFMNQFRVIIVPGSGFFRPGHFRISFAVPDDTIERSIEFFQKAGQKLGI